MISRLLKDLGVPLQWIDSHDAAIIRATVGRSFGLFFVEEAAGASDHKGRKVIPEQDFVSTYKVKSIFGTGGAYAGGQIVVMIIFCRDVLSRAAVEPFLVLTDLFQQQTRSLVETSRIFAE